MLSLLFLLQSLKAIGCLLFILRVVSRNINCHQYLLIKISYPVVVANLMLSDVVVRPFEMKKNPLN